MVWNQSLSTKPASTALATSPTPACQGSPAGSRPFFVSWRTKSRMWAAMRRAVSSGSENTAQLSSASLRRMPTTRFGSMSMNGLPMRSPAR